MKDIYQVPKSDLENSDTIVFKPHWFWKVFFLIHVLFSPLLILVFFFTESLSAFDYFDLFTFPVILAVLYGYIYSKRIGMRVFWKASCVFYPLWVLFYEIVVPFVLGLPQYGEPASFDVFFILVPLFTFPTCYVLYLYGFKVKHVWDS